MHIHRTPAPARAKGPGSEELSSTMGRRQLSGFRAADRLQLVTTELPTVGSPLVVTSVMTICESSLSGPLEPRSAFEPHAACPFGTIRPRQNPSVELGASVTSAVK